MRAFVRGGLVLLALVFATVAEAAPTFPALTGRVVDQTGIIPAAIAERLDAKLRQLEEKNTDQFVVATVKSLEGYDIQDYGVQLGRAWGIGQKGKNNGLILLVAPNEHKVGFEVGYGLEGTMTDALTQVIIQSSILPRFRANDYAGGIERGVDDAIQVLSGDAEEIQKQAEKRPADGGFWSGIAPVLVIIVIFIVISSLRRGAGRRRGGSGLGWLIASAILNSRSSRGGWSGGGGGSWGGSSGGGGFSGGGGSFGGGGSSGSW
ncbi:MAG TPA: TPM domain-containing protein [Bauldia sp.]|nr:TPM domain-containing protein [Bauldia sp.]